MTATALVIPNPQPDLAHAERFLTRLDETAEFFTFQTFDDLKGRKDPSLARVLHGPLERHATDLERLQWRRAGVYVTVNATDGKGRKLANMTRPRGIFCEWDHAGHALPDWPLEPQIVVESSPGKYHVYWLAADLEWADYDRLMQVMVEWGSDRNARDRARVLRVPGFWHQKHETPFQVRMVEDTARLPYGREALLEAFPIGAPKPAPAVGGAAPEKDAHHWMGVAVRLAGEHAARTWADPTTGRHAQVLSLGFELASHGAPESVDEPALRAFEKLMRPCDTAGAICGLDWDSEWKALQAGRQKAKDGPTVIHGAAVAKKLLESVSAAGDTPFWTPDADPSDDAIPEEALTLPFGIGPQLLDYLTRTSLHPNRVIAAQTARTFLAVVLSRRHATSQRNHASLFAVLIGKTACGKEDGKHQIETLLAECGLERLIGGKGYSHPSAIYTALQDEPKHLTLIDEFGLYLREQNNPQSTINLLMREYMELFGRAHGLHQAPRLSGIGQSKAERETLKKLRAPIVKPALNLLAMSTPETLWASLSRDHLDNGFLNRFLLVETRAARRPVADLEPLDVPADIRDWVEAVTDRRNPLAYSQQFVFDLDPPITTWTLAAEAKRAMRSFEAQALDWANQWDDRLAGLGNLPLRANEISLRLALQNAVLEGREDRALTVDHLLHAQIYVKTHLFRAAESIHRGMVSSPFEAHRNVVLEALRRAGRAGVTEREMKRNAPFTRFSAKELTDLLASLHEGWLIAKVNVREGSPGPRREAWVALDPKQTAQYCESSE